MPKNNTILSLPSYVLVTPARNEAQFIEMTIHSVISQTVLPSRWIIVSDGSTDSTDTIVDRYTRAYPWIDLIRLPARKERHFGGKATAFSAGYNKIKNLSFDIVGNVDADASFEKDHFEFLLSRFVENPSLGVAGTPFRQGSQQYNYRFTSIEHVSGACQLFRRTCFDSIGGYAPLKEGGVDLLAVIIARMKGWETRTFLEKTYIHHRKMGTELHSGLRSWFKGGLHDYQMGANFVWQIFRCFYQMSLKPYFISGGTILAGYFWGLVTRTDRIVPDDVIAFRKQEQLRRLKKYFLAILHSHSLSND